MFICTIELRHYIFPESQEEEFFTAGRYQFDPGFKKGDEISLFSLGLDSRYRGSDDFLKVKVIDRKTDLYICGERDVIKRAIKFFRLDKSLEDELYNSGIINLRIFVEAEDRDAVVRWSENIRKINPQLFSNPTE